MKEKDDLLEIFKLEDERFLAELKGKDADEVLTFYWQAKGRAGLGAYQMLQALRFFESTGDFTKVGFESFRECVNKLAAFSEIQYRTYLRAAYKFQKELIEKVGFPILSSVLQRRLPQKSQEIIIDTIEKEIDDSGIPPTNSEIKVLIAKLQTPLEFRERKEGKLRQQVIIIIGQKKRIRELELENRDLREQNEKLKLSLEDSKKYVEELQLGKRGM